MKEQEQLIYLWEMNSEKTKVFLLLGSNSGDCRGNINKALTLIERNAGKIILKSSKYETSPWGFTEQPDFLNQVVVIETSLQPLNLLRVLKKIEKDIGRVNNEKWKQRIIDIDILFYEELVFESDELIIPHPLMHHRMFTLVPLREINADFIHPLLKKNVQQMMDECKDAGEVRKMKEDLRKS